MRGKFVQFRSFLLSRYLSKSAQIDIDLLTQKNSFRSKIIVTWQQSNVIYINIAVIRESFLVKIWQGIDAYCTLLSLYS